MDIPETYADRPEVPRHLPTPDYDTLIAWWEAWPECRPEMLDFWARGGFIQRQLSHKAQRKAGVVVRVSYIDELETVLKRLCLLGIPVDFLWTGATSERAVSVAPQDIDFEGVGGWGYMTCSGDEFTDRRGGKEWCPSLAITTLLPDTVTDWMAEQAVDFVRDGTTLIAPVDCVGVPHAPDEKHELHFQRLGNCATAVNVPEAVQLISEIDLPGLEGMSMADTYTFCRDHDDELLMFRRAISELLLAGDRDIAAKAGQVAEQVAEIRLGGKFSTMRQRLVKVGGGISACGISIGLQLGMELSAAAIGVAGGATAALTLWDQIVARDGELRQNPFWIAWKLSGGKGPKPTWRPRHFTDGMSLPPVPEGSKQRPYHWIAPPTGGWVIPTFKIPNHNG